jgi:hypothetical protein
MSKKETIKKKLRVAKISEEKLIDLIDGIVKEAVAEKKEEWIKENADTVALAKRLTKLEEAKKPKKAKAKK